MFRPLLLLLAFLMIGGGYFFLSLDKRAQPPWGERMHLQTDDDSLTLTGTLSDYTPHVIRFEKGEPFDQTIRVSSFTIQTSPWGAYPFAALRIENAGPLLNIHLIPDSPESEAGLLRLFDKKKPPFSLHLNGTTLLNETHTLEGKSSPVPAEPDSLTLFLKGVSPLPTIPPPFFQKGGSLK